MLATVAATDRASKVRKKYSVFINSKVESPAMYTIYKQTGTLCDSTVFRKFHKYWLQHLTLRYTLQSTFKPFSCTVHNSFWDIVLQSYSYFICDHIPLPDNTFNFCKINFLI